MSTPQGSAPAGGHGNTKKNKNRSSKKNKGPSKPKMTKEERRAKYTKIAHDRRDRKISSARSKNLVCFRCRRKGHAAADCTTDLGDGSEAPASDNPLVSAGRGGGKHCYKCGSIDHGLSKCPKMKNAPRLPSGKIDFTKVDLPHATCYICNTMGHLASSCDKNEGRGIFVKGGGGCRLCGSVQHIASDCPDNDKKKKKRRGDDDDVEVDDDGAAVVDDLLEEEEEGGNKDSWEKKVRQRSEGNGDSDGIGNDDDEDDDAAAVVKPEPPKMKKRRKKVVNF
jgi:zinc finger CCHC domain-containing protein 9